MLASSRITRITFCFTAKTKTADAPTSSGTSAVFFMTKQRQHRTIPALRLKHRSGSCGTASALPKCSIMSGCGTRIVLRGQKPLALCDRCPCFGSLFPPLAALTFAASSIICAFGLASAAPRSPYRHLELCGIALRRAGVPAHPFILFTFISKRNCPRRTAQSGTSGGNFYLFDYSAVGFCAVIL